MLKEAPTGLLDALLEFGDKERKRKVIIYSYLYYYLMPKAYWDPRQLEL